MSFLFLESRARRCSKIVDSAKVNNFLIEIETINNKHIQQPLISLSELPT